MGLGDNYFLRMADGTVKQLNPFTGTEVWSVPGRSPRLDNGHSADAAAFEPGRREDYCHFCEANWTATPPEKSRLVRSNGDMSLLHHVPFGGMHATRAEFRRLPKLLETIGFEYWAKNYGYKLSDRARNWKEHYLADPDARQHLERVLRKKYAVAGRSQDELTARLKERNLPVADPFFGGCHELIVPMRHYQRGATNVEQVECSGSLSALEHRHYMELTIRALEDIHSENRYVRYVSIYQNYLRGAGASCDHLHKQLVGLDEWGFQLGREVAQLRQDPNIYNHLAANLAMYHNLQVAENEHAIAVVEFGQRWPTLSVFSKSRHGRPEDHGPEELRAMSDLIHACHTTASAMVPSTEEWYYPPLDLTLRMPWRVLIKWRITVPTGFEGGTRIYINPLDPWALRDMTVDRLRQARAAGHISDLAIGEECPAEPNPLQYYKG